MSLANDFKSWCFGRLRRRGKEQQDVPDVPRARFARQLSGTGVEIGALASPLWLPRGVRARYVDKFDHEKLCAHNPDVPAARILRPDVVSDTVTLDELADGAQDFVIACHLLEHTHDPIRALLAWHRVLKPGGRVLCIVPDGRYTFDRGRPLTTLDHLLWDFANAGTETKLLLDLGHVAECNLNMHPSLTPRDATDLAWRILDDSYDTHFHVWTHDSLRAHLVALIADWGLPFVLLDSESDEQSEALFLLEATPRDAERFKLHDDVAPRASR